MNMDQLMKDSQRREGERYDEAVRESYKGLQQNKFNDEKCLWDDMKDLNGNKLTVGCLSCPCPKCTLRC